MSSDQRNVGGDKKYEPFLKVKWRRSIHGGGICILTDIEAAPPGWLPSAAEADGGKGDVGHIGNLPPRRHRARYKRGQIYMVSQKKAHN